MSKSVKLYGLFPMGAGFSNKTINYQGVAYQVAAVSNKQAHYFANNDVWAADVASPAGIVEVYRRGAGNPGDHWLWDGCRVFGGLNVQHGDGKRAISAAMREHLNHKHSPVS